MLAQFIRRRVLPFAMLVPASAQVTGSISGTVEDSSGAAVPGALVTVTHLETGTAPQCRNRRDREYRALSLPVGAYE